MVAHSFRGPGLCDLVIVQVFSMGTYGERLLLCGIQKKNYTFESSSISQYSGQHIKSLMWGPLRDIFNSKYIREGGTERYRQTDRQRHRLIGRGQKGEREMEMEKEKSPAPMNRAATSQYHLATAGQLLSLNANIDLFSR